MSTTPKYRGLVSACLLLALTSNLPAATTILAATPIGPVKSIDGGVTWSVIPVNYSGGLLSGQPTADIVAVDAKTPTNWYFTGAAAGGVFGFYRSADSGQTWTGTAFVGITPVASLVIDAVTSSTMYMIASSVGSQTFIIRSVDYGVTWTKLKLPNTLGYPVGNAPDGSVAFSVTTDPKVTGLVYAVGSKYIFKSTDFGATWTVLSTGVDTPEASAGQAAFPGLNRVDVDPSVSTTLFASASAEIKNLNCKGTPAGGLCGLYRSIDNGATWVQMGLQSYRADSVSIDPVSGAIYAGAMLNTSGAVFKSTDGGTIFTPLKSGVSSYPLGPLVRVDPNNPSTVYAFAQNNDTPYYRSADAGATWTSVPLPRLCPVSNPKCTNAGTSRFVDVVLVPPPAAAGTGGPAISANGVQNGASFLPGFSQGSWITIKGSGLSGTTRIWTSADFNGNTLPTQLDGVSVTINGKPAYVYYISPTQINVLTPADAALGPVQVQASYGGQASSAVTANESAFSPALFMFDPLGGKYVAAVRSDGQFLGPPNLYSGLTVPAKGGDTVLLFGTGFGPTNPAATIGQTVDGAPPTANTVTATIGGVPAPVLFAGLVAPGEYQFNVVVPSGLPPGDKLVVLSVGGVSTQASAYLTLQ